MDRRVRVRDMSVSTNHARAKVRSDLGGRATNAPSGANQNTVSPAFSPAGSMPHHAAMQLTPTAAA
jgi:hypothetical protein